MSTFNRIVPGKVVNRGIKDGQCPPGDNHFFLAMLWRKMENAADQLDNDPEATKALAEKLLSGEMSMSQLIDHLGNMEIK